MMSRHPVLTVVALLAASGAAAQSPGRDTLRLADALRVARDSNPMLRAVRAGATAAGQRVGPAGALPDPELQLGLMNRMARDFGATMDPMTMDQVQLMQMLPWPGKLGNQRRAARHGAAAARADVQEQERMLAAQVRMAYYEVAYADRALAVMAETRTLLEQFLSVSTTMYATGGAIQQDVLRAQVEVARMTEDIERMAQERVAMAARLNALLGRPGGSPVGAATLPAPSAAPLPLADTLIAWALADRPALAAGAERVAAADASLAAARREVLPDFSIGVAYQRRPAFDDMVSLMIGVSLPLWAGAKQLPMRREAAAMRAMAAAELASLETETAARIVELRARAERDRALARLYRTGIVPQARAAVQAALASYRVGRVTFMTLIDNQMTVNRYAIETHRLAADYHQALGELEAFVGRALAGTAGQGDDE
jgi:outer membrane protein TolC